MSLATVRGHIVGPVPKVLLWGGRSTARIVQEMLREGNAGTAKIVFDSTLERLSFDSDALFLNNVSDLRVGISEVTHFVVCIGGQHGYARLRTAEALEKLGLIPMTLIHERSFIEPTATIGMGCQIMPCAVIHKFSRVGPQTIINSNGVVDHECVIGKGVHIMGSAAITGRVEIGDYATIGTNATILPSIKIGEGAYVGAGAVVTKDVEPYSVVAGVPAKKMRNNVLEFTEEPLAELMS